MRKLMWFTIGFGAACAFCAYTWTTSGLILPAIVFAVLFAAGLYAGSWVKHLKIVAALCLGIGLGLTWFHVYNVQYLDKAAKLDGMVADVELYCTDYAYQTEYGSAVEGFLYLDGKPCKAKFYIRGTVQIEPGDVLSGGFELRVTTQDSDKGATYHPGKGILLLGYQRDDASLLKPTQRPFWAYPAILRQNIVAILDGAFPADAAPFAKALLLGDRTDIDYELNTAFRISGIMHVIAVSGLHVTILFTLLNLLLLKRRWLVALVGIPALLIFAAAAGFSPSIVRACIMQCLMIGATLLNREYDGPTELACASLVMLVINPLVITSVSFQLSVGCMVGIFLFQKRIYDWACEKLGCEKHHRFVKVKRWLAGSVSVTLSATLLTTPLSAYYFGAVSLVGVVTNLLVLWAVSLVFYGIIAVCIAGIFSAQVSLAIAGGVSWLIRYVLTAARTLADFPLSDVYTHNIYFLAWVVFVYILLAVFFLTNERKPGRLILCAAFGLLLCMGAAWLEPRTDDCRMTVLNVGQGQCIILQSDDRTYLVDCGGDYDADTADLAAETLLSQGIRRVDGLILTHFDRDHAGAAPLFLSRIPADMICIPNQTDDGGIRANLEDRYRDSVVVIDEPLQLFYGDTALSIYPSPVPESENEGSLAVLFQSGTCDILITGDRNAFGERLLMNEIYLPKLDILVAGHHGSADSTCEELLAATRPGIVAISVGENSYGHPSQEVLDRLQRYGCAVYRTDLDGNLIFRR